MRWFHGIFAEEMYWGHRVEIAEILSLSLFRKNLVKAMVLLKELLNSWFDEICYSEREFIAFPHCGGELSHFRIVIHFADSEDFDVSNFCSFQFEKK